MRDERLEDRVDEVRRKLLKASAVVGGGLVLGHLPYQKPAWKSFFGVRSAWAQPTSFLSLTLQNQLGTPGNEGNAEDTGQDCWQIPAVANSNWSITATPDMNLQPELFLYAPGAVGAGQTNLLTGTPFGLAAPAVGSPVAGAALLPVTGTYTICIEDERSAFNQVAGQYTIVITSDRPMGAPVIDPNTPLVDEGPESEGPESPPG